MNKDASVREPMPHDGKHIIYPMVIEDIRSRSNAGHRKYETFLQSCNGRDALMDAYQEAIDLVMYLKQLLVERDGV